MFMIMFIAAILDAFQADQLIEIFSEPEMHNYHYVICKYVSKSTKSSIMWFKHVQNKLCEKSEVRLFTPMIKKGGD